MENKKLKHIKVYDKLYEMIINGTYPAGSQLPSENILATQMDVSRMTLRKALTLLQDDGLTKNVQGVGHFVISDKDTAKHNSKNTSQNINPVFNYCIISAESTEFKFRIEPPTKSITDSLNHYTPAVVIADRWYKNNNTAFAYSLSIIPIDIIGENHIDLNDSDKLLDFLNNNCYSSAISCHRICTHSSAGNFSSKEYILSDKDSFMLVQENIYDNNNRIIISNKHFIPFDKFKIEINI